MKSAEIKFIRFANAFGRTIASGQLHSGEKVLLDGSIAQILQYAKKEGIKISNAQEILELIVLQGGFAS